MHPKAKKRIAVLVGAAALVLVTGGSFYAYRKVSIRQEFAALRAQGLAENAKGRHPEAVLALEQYIGRYPNDVEALVAFYKSRLEVPLPGDVHKRPALGALQRIVSIEPGRIDERTALAELLSELGQLPEALQGADKVLEARPGDPTALGVRASVLMRLRRTADAATAARKWAEAAPDNPRALLMSLGLAEQTGTTPGDIKVLANGMILRATRELTKSVVRSALAASAGDIEGAKREILRAAAERPANAIEVRMISVQLEGLGLQVESARYLGAAADSGLLADGKLAAVRRLVETGNWAVVVEMLGADPTANTAPAGPAASTDANARRTQLEFIALHAISLAASGNLARAQALVAEIRKQDSKGAAAWVTLLDFAPAAGTGERPERLIEIITDALRDGETAPLLSLALADAYLRTGETDRAISLYDDLARRSTSWSRPLERKAQALASTGQFAAAMDAAEKSVKLRPDAGSLTTLGEVWTAAVAAGVRKDEKELEAFLSRLSKAMPGDFTLAPSRVMALSRAKRLKEARALIEEVVAKAKADPGPAWGPMFLRLASVSASAELGGSPRLVDLAETYAGVSPQSAFTRALITAAGGDPKAALAAFDAARQAALQKTNAPPAAPPAAQADAVQWQAARARLLDTVGEPGAAAAWVAVADANPDNASLQREALGAAAVRADFEFRRRAIERLKKASGSVAFWKVAEVRLLLEAGGDAKDFVRASDDLTDLLRQSPASTDARFLLAACLIRTGNSAAAIEQLRTIVKQSPESQPPALMLAEQLQRRGDFAGAGQVIDGLIGRKLIGDLQRRGAASLLARQGDPDRAIDLLEEDAAGRGADLLIAQLHRQSNDLPAAEKEARKVVAAQPDVLSVRLLAEVLRAQGKTAEAESTLGKLADLKLPAGSVELVRADYHMRFSEVPQALAAARKATELAPTNPSAWQILATVLAFSGDTDGAIATLDAAARQIPNNATVEAQRAQSALIRKAAADPVTRPLIVAMLQQPEDASLLDALRTPTSGTLSEGGPGASLVRAYQLAEKYPNSLPVQALAVRRMMQFGQYAQAADIAARATRAFPVAPEPAALAASAYAAMKDNAQALAFARTWRARSTTDPLPAELAHSEALVLLGRYDDAIRVLAPYLRDFTQDPRALLPVLFRTAEAHTLAGREDVAARLLDPHLTGKPELVLAWLDYTAPRLAPPVLIRWAARLAARPEASDPAVAFGLARIRADALGRLKDPAAVGARRALTALAAGQAGTPSQVLTAAVIHDDANEIADAETGYRAMLALVKDDPVSRNNLAMILVRRNGDLAEAQRIAEEAVAAAPTVATFHDTLASVLAARGQFAKAQDAVRKAIELDPATAEWWVHLAEVQLAEAKKPEATATLQNLASIPPDALPPPIRERLAAAQANASAR